MTRRVKSRNRKYAGDRTYGGGNKKNRRGKGSKGGRGRAGFHKHKWLRTAKYELDILRAKHTGFNSIYKKTRAITLEQINALLVSGKLEKKDGMVHFAFPNAKVIGSTPLTDKVYVFAFAFSKGAKKAIEVAGGKTEIPAPRPVPVLATKPTTLAKKPKK